MKEKKHPGRTVAVLGGAGLLAWLLLRGGNAGWAKGKGNGPGDGVTSRGVIPGIRCVVWIRADRIEVDGVAADLPTVVARCRAVGAAEVRATGNAITGVVRDVIRALQAAGVKLQLPPDLAHLAASEAL